MNILHRQIVRRARQLTGQRWTRRAVVVLGILLLLASLGYNGPAFAANQTKTVNTKADWELGALTNIDSEAKPDTLQLQAAGSWGARSLAEPPDTIESGSAFASDGTYVYALRGGSFPWLWRYDPVRNTWSRLADAPFTIGAGSDMRYDQSGAIYVAAGLYSNKFMKYTIATNTWTTLANVPDIVGPGAGLAYDGTYMYLLRGNSSQDFYRYNLSSNTWEPLTGAPATIAAGGDLVYNSGYLYAFRGANTLSFYRYDIAAATWSDPAVADLPAGATMNGDGNSMVVGDYIYKAKSAATTSFYRYSISGNTWSQLTDMPLTVNYGGLIYVSGTDTVYSFRGSSTRTLWAWNPNTSAWLGSPEPIISGTAYTVSTGGSLISDGSQYLYLLRGANTNQLLRYDTVGATWSLMANATVAATNYNFNTDTFGVKAGGYLYFFQGGTTTMLRYDIGGNTWSLMAVAPAAISNGGGLVYTGSGDYIYALRGAGTASFYRYSILGNTWDDAGAADLPTSPQTSVANVGARMVSDGTDIYATLGNGTSRFLKYSVLGNSWSELTSAPFPSYYGNALEYKSGKIYALAGYYKSSFYEYNVSGNSWRKLQNAEQSSAGNIGAYTGAAIAVMGSNIYAVRGNGTTDFWTYTISSNTYLASGSYVSPIYDLTYVSSWVSLASTTTGGSDSSLLIETRTSADNSSWSSYQALSGSSIQSPANRFVQVRVTLTASTDTTVSPTISAYTITYTGDITAPTNPSSATGYSQQVGGTTLTSGNSYAYTAPYFTWTAGSDAGAGLKGYYVYFGTNNAADPSSAGTFTSSTSYTANAAMTAGTYYLRLMAVDNSNNKAAIAFDAFTYVYNGVTPPQTLTATSQANFTTGSTLTNVSATQSSGDLQLSSSTGFWNEDSLTPPPATIYYGAKFAYVSSNNKLYTPRGNNTTTFYSYDLSANTWTTETSAPVAIYTGGGLVEGPTGYLYAWAGNNLSTFMRYDINAGTWDDSAAADLPLSATYGAAAVYDGSRYIYFLRGNVDDAFWKYDTQNNSWTTLANTQYGNGSSQFVYEGGNLAYDGNDTIYSTQGNNYHYFAKYTISTNTWTPLSPSPVGFYSGGTLSYDSATGALYSLAGNGRGAFLKYTISSDSWSELQDPPLYESFGATQKLVGRNIYTLRGANTTTFWIYDLDRGVWKKPVQNVFQNQYAGTIYYPVSNGASFVKGDGNYYYATRGNVDNQFIRFDRTTGQVTALAPLPEGVTTGGSLAYDSVHGTVYATTGISTQDFFQYTISTNTWTKINSGVTDLIPASLNDGSDMVFDGSRYIYLSRGASGAQFYRYDTTAAAGSRWSTMTSSTAAASTGGSMVYNSGYIYMTRGASTASFYRYDVGANTWSDPVVADAPGTVSTGGSLSQGGDGNLYLARGNIGVPPQNWYSYNITSNTWSTLSNAPAGWGAGGDIAGNNGEQLYGFLGQGVNALGDSIYTYTQQTSTTSFAKSGNYLSIAHDLTSVYKWANLTVNYSTPSNTTVSIQTQTSPDNSTWSSLTAVTNEQINGNTHTYQIASPAAEFIRVKISFTSDGVYTPTVNDYSINYYQDTTAPTNPSSVTAKDSHGGSTTLTTNTWYNYATPDFSWPAEGATGGGADNAGGSGVDGYYLYFGTDNTADPTITSGIINSGSAVQYQSGTTLTLASSLTSGQTYYLLLRTKDKAGNTASATWNAFTYKYDNTAPTLSGSVSASPAGYSAVDSFTFSWTAGSDTQSGLLKYQYRTGGDGANSWTDMSPLTANSVALPNGNHAQGQYQSGTNVFYLRAVDNAGNVSSTASTNYYYSGSAPTPPQNVAVNPTSSTSNSFTVTWDPPATYVGDLNQLSYYWSVNALPTSTNTVSTPTTSVGPTALATQQGQNTFYVVAKDGAGNIDYSLYGSVQFDATTSAPSVPNNFTVNDLSDRDSQKYGAALSWAAPTTYDAGNFSGYKVYQSSDGTHFSLISTTSGTAYVDQNLTGGQKYYYKVTAYTKTNVESAATSVLNVVPTGKFTSAPTIGSGSITTAVYARKVDFTWLTTRAKGDGSGTSFAKCGLTIDDLAFTAGDFTQIVQHDVTIEGLTPSTTYECYLYSADIDGNTATYGPMQITTAPPPVVQDLTVTDITLHSARINFTTNVDAKGALNYGQTSSFGGSATFSDYQRDFSVQLTGLNDTTTYYYGFTLTTRDGDTFGQEVINKFDTLPLPVVSNVKVTVVQDVDTPSLDITYQTNVQTTTTVLYSFDGGKAQEATNSAKPLSTDHEITLNNLAAFKDYALVVGGQDAFGNDAVSQTVHAQTKGRTKPPQVMTFSTENSPQTNGKTTIIARVQTDEPTTAVMELAQGSSAQSFSVSSEESPLNQNHSLSLDVNSGTIYSVRVKLTDDYGNVAYTKVENVSGGVSKLTPVQIVTQTLNDNFGWIFHLWHR